MKTYIVTHVDERRALFLPGEDAEDCEQNLILALMQIGEPVVDLSVWKIHEIETLWVMGAESKKMIQAAMVK